MKTPPVTAQKMKCIKCSIEWTAPPIACPKCKYDPAEEKRLAEQRREEKFRLEQEEKRRVENERARQRAQEQARISALIQSGSVIQRPQNEIVTCSNGHIYAFRDFLIEESTVNTYIEREARYDRYGDITGYQDSPHTESESDYRIGCPFCKSTLYSFQNPAIEKFQRCSCGYWFKRHLFIACPVCNQRPQQ
jgi:hypothetical protein